ncbi:MAG: hypothetical protein BWY15_00422 [Firmicutes bacterium ADurb.Bin193]|nr:MAG: hypothetical protein BWY15_00422 [Firmicutes bacterium ADurb.Bin193]
MNDYAIFFKYENLILRLPVNPPSFKIRIPSKNETFNIIGLGDINIIKEAGLREISFDSFLPSQPAGSYVLTSGRFFEPTVYLDFFSKIKADKKPFTFIVNRYLPAEKRIHDTNMEMTIEDYDVTEHGGEVGDFYYSILLKEYRKYGVKKV